MFFESLELNLSRDNYLQSHKVMEIYSGEVTSKKPLGLWVEVTSLYNTTSLLALYSNIGYYTKFNLEKKYIWGFRDYFLQEISSFFF
jgi:hypothetical protein